MRRYRRQHARRALPLHRRAGRVAPSTWLGVGAVAVALVVWAQHSFHVVLPGGPWAWPTVSAVVSGLLALHSWLDARRRRAWARTMHRVEDLLRLDWRAFERWTAEAYRAQGFRVQVVGGGGADGGVDLVCTRADGVCLVQCKHWQGQVGAKVVREMFGLMHHHGAVAADIVALKGFTRQAREFAQGKPMRLLDGAATINALQRRS